MLDEKNNNLPEESEDVQSTESENNSEPTNKEEVTVALVNLKDTTEEEVVNQIDDDIAQASEKLDDEEEHQETAKESLPEYSKMGLEDLVLKFEKHIKELPVQKINNHFNAIKDSFNLQFSKILANKKAAFLADGGESIDFSYSNPSKIKFNELSKEYRDKRTKYYKDLESKLNGNLELRFILIEQLKDLIEDAEPKTMYNKFRDIQERWRKIGPVAREKYNGTWRTFHHHVERFYDLLHLSNDFRDLDFKHNLEEKLKLIERVEALSESNDINYSFKQLQVIHKMWKEDVGPVAKEQREDVWKKFSAATKKIHDKRHDYYKGLKEKYQENIAKKNEIIEQIKNIDSKGNLKHSDWQKSIKEIEDLRQQFFKAGNVPRSESDKIWGKFKEATKSFNHDKNAFYKNIKGEQQENLTKKLKLIELANLNKDSEDWDATTELMKKIQSDWKKIGHVPRKNSDKIWGEFKAACNHYFDRFHTFKNQGSKEDQEAVKAKKEFLNKMKEEVATIEKVTIETVKKYMDDWKALGSIPFNLRHIEGKFSKTLDKLFSQLSVSNEEKEMMKFESQMEGLLAQKNLRKLDTEQIFLRKKIDELAREIQQLENNMSFFSNTDSKNPLLKNVMNNIENHKENYAILKAKLSYITHLDY